MARFPRFPKRLAVLGAGLLLAASGCDDSPSNSLQRFSLHFAAMDGATQVGCGDVMDGFGDDGMSTVEVSDLRFFVSNLRFFKADGTEASVTLDENEFQYVGDDGIVSLIDLTGTSTGACSGDGLTYPEGTARTNDAITGLVNSDAVTRVSFDVGVPQALMKSVIMGYTAEDAPSPLAELHWSWGFAYRHLVMNFLVVDGGGVEGEGYLHVGSNDCGGDGTRALTDRDECGKVNAPHVSLASFSLDDNVVAIDVRKLLEGLDLRVDVGGGTVLPGCSCHSSVSQPDCAEIFGNLGIDQATGAADVELNEAFMAQ